MNTSAGIGVLEEGSCEESHDSFSKSDGYRWHVGISSVYIPIGDVAMDGSHQILMESLLVQSSEVG